MTAYVRLDIILLSLLRSGTAEIGWYSVPVKIIEAFSIFPYLIMSGLFPIFSLLGDRDQDLLKEAYQKSLGYLVMTAIPLVLLTLHLADPWLVVVFGPLFQNSILSLEIIVWVVPFIFIHYALVHILFSLIRERLVIFGSALALVFNLGGQPLAAAPLWVPGSQCANRSHRSAPGILLSFSPTAFFSASSPAQKNGPLGPERRGYGDPFLGL